MNEFLMLKKASRREKGRCVEVFYRMIKI